MPNTLTGLLPSSSYTVANDPTNVLTGSGVAGDISSNPYEEITDELLFGLGNDILEIIDDATGLNFLGLVTPLEHFISGGVGDLLQNFFGFLTPGTGIFPTSNSTSVGGAGNVLSGLFDGTGAFLTHLIPDITASLSTDLTNTIATAQGTVTKVQSFIDGLWSGLTGHSSTGKAVSDVTNAADSVASKAVSATTTQSQQAIAKPNYIGGDSTVDGPFPIANLTGSTAPLISVTQAASVICFIDTTDNAVKSSVSWLGQNTTNLTGFYLTVWKQNVFTGLCTIHETSVNILGNVRAALDDYNYYDLISPINTGVGDTYAVEVRVTGTGTYQIAGEPADWKPRNSKAAYPLHLGSSRTSPALYDQVLPAAYTLTTTANNINATFNGPNVAVGDYVIVWVAAQRTNHSSTSDTATYAGVAMTNLQSLNLGGGSGTTTGVFTAYGIKVDGTTVPAGVQSIHIALTGTLTIQIQDINVSCYANVGTVTASSSSGTGTALTSGAIASVVTDVVAQGFAQGGASATPMAFSGYNGTQRANQALSQGSAYQLGVTIGDVTGVTSTTFTATSPDSATWASIAVVLHTAGVSTPPTLFTPPVYTGVAPWLGLGSVLFNGPTPSQYSVAGTYTYNIPNWLKYGDLIDCVCLGSGGGGQSAATYFVGNGGGSGSFVGMTLTYGIDIPVGTTTLTIIVGAGGHGSGGGTGAWGLSGNDSELLMGTGVYTILVDGAAGPGGGAPGSPSGGTQTGASPGSFAFNGKLYVPTSSNGKGGTGAGAYGVGSSAVDGEVWMTAYQAGKTPF